MFIETVARYSFIMVEMHIYMESGLFHSTRLQLVSTTWVAVLLKWDCGNSKVWGRYGSVVLTLAA